MPLTLALYVVLAWPVDMIHDVEPGREKFVKLGAIDWAESEDPSIATAEVMESGELLLTGAGFTTVVIGLAIGTTAWLQKRVVFHL